MHIRNLAPFFLMLLLAACATTDPDAGRVSIATESNGQPLDGAQCSVTTSSASWNIVTPAMLVIGRGDGDLRIVCTKQGYRTSELILPPYQQPAGSSVGLGMGGVSGNVGMGLGMSFPLAADGYYPARVVVNMNRL
jgi:hypothetical protein